MDTKVLFKPEFTDLTKEALRRSDRVVLSRLGLGLPPWLARALFSAQRGAAGAWVFTDVGRTKLLDGTFNVESDSFKMALHLDSGTQPAAGIEAWSELATSEHAAEHGYEAGGIAVALSLTGTTTVKVDIDTDPVWTASSGSIVAHWAVIYKVGGDVLCYCHLDATPGNVTVTDGNTLTVAAHADGVFSLA